MTRLVANRITKTFTGGEIIRDICIYLDNGEIVSLLGASGVGKTTLFNIVSGLTVPDYGEILLDSRNITGKSGFVSYMQQKDLLLNHKKMIDNVSLPLILRGERKKNARDYAGAFFEMFGLSGSEYKYPNQLSGGMRQRAALLRTYLFNSDICLLDEPFSALDAITKRTMHSWFLDLSQSMNISALFITHDIDEAIFLSDRIYIMAGVPGEIRYELKIETKRPKSSDFLISKEFVEYKRTILNVLT